MFAEDEAEQGALARAIGTDQAMDFAGLQREVDIGRDMQSAEALVELARFQKRHQAAPRLERRAASR